MTLFRRLAALLLVLTLAAAPAALAQESPAFPTLTGRVVDEADLLSPETEAALETRLAQLETDISDQLVVVTVRSLQDLEIEDYGYRLGRAWGIGQSETDNGVLLIVAPVERRVRIEVGYGLEPILTDAWSALTIHNDILPRFREGAYEAGILAGVDAAEAPRASTPVGPAILVALVFLFLFLGLIGGGLRGRRRRPDGLGPIIAWTVLDALSRSGGRGGGSFGGGFGGGGGSFGGGGASGGW